MFDETMVERFKVMENPKEWMKNFLINAKNKSNAKDIKTQIESREYVKKYADFSCSKCGTLYLKDQAIVNQGVCTSCNGKIICISDNLHDQIITSSEENFHDNYECKKCGWKDSLESIKKNNKICSNCSGKSFVKISLMERVVQNTIQINQVIDTNLIDAEHEKGKVYAYYSYDGQDGEPVNVVVMAEGKFKENDFIHFDLNNGSPRALVASMNDDPLVKFSVSENALCTWAIDEPEEYEYNDTNNRKITKGAKLEWFVPEGCYAGNVSEITAEGVVVQLNKHPKYGTTKGKKDLGKVLIDKEYIIENKISCF